MTAKELHRYMTERRLVELDDGRCGHVLRLDTAFPDRQITVSIWTTTTRGPQLAKVDLSRVIGPAPEQVA